jgi:hypothetical protein
VRDDLCGALLVDRVSVQVGMEAGILIAIVKIYGLTKEDLK